jgi:hypothetical protein
MQNPSHTSYGRDFLSSDDIYIVKIREIKLMKVFRDLNLKNISNHF